MSTARTYHAEAITLKATPFAERDKLLVLYTRHHGKLRVLAKGVRRTTSRMAGHIDLFSHAAIFLVHGRTFDSITQGQALERFPLLHEDLWRFSLACYCAELVDRFTEDVGLPSPGLFEALLGALRRLNDGALDPALAVRAFELDLLGLVGYRPQLHRCVGCDALIKPEANAFSYADGGVLCPACAARSATAIPVSVEALRILRNLQTRPEAIIGHVRVGEETLDQAEHILIGYIQYLLDVRIRSVGFIDVLRRLRSARERSVVVG
jgi:DNA repair protein RecO (recombination protein O)